MKFLQHELPIRLPRGAQLSRSAKRFSWGAALAAIGLRSMLRPQWRGRVPAARSRPSRRTSPRRPSASFSSSCRAGRRRSIRSTTSRRSPSTPGQRPAEVDRKSLRNTKNGLFPSPFGFKQYGQCGKWVSDIFPHVGECVDDICFIHSMHTDIPEHAGAMMMMNVGHLQPNRPSMGSWLMYGLGTENQNLPGFVAMSPRAQPRGGLANWGNSFLPGAYAGCYVNIAEMKPESVLHDLRNRLRHRATTSGGRLDLLGQLNRLHADRAAARRRARRPHRRDGDGVPHAVLRAGGVRHSGRNASRRSTCTATANTPRAACSRGGWSSAACGCVQLSHSIDGYDIAWDTGHNDIASGHAKLAKACDQGIAALLKDLKQRGLLDETLVVWGGEFGRAPTSEGAKGRDHDHYGFTIWMAGGGVKGGISYGATDEFGCSAVENRVHVHDLHATILHLMGLDHEKLTYRYSGRDYRLTDVHGHVVRDIIA